MGSHDLCIEQSNRRGSLEVLDNVAFAAFVKLGGYTVTQLSSRTAAFWLAPLFTIGSEAGTQHIVVAHSLCVAPLYTLTCFFYVIYIAAYYYSTFGIGRRKN